MKLIRPKTRKVSSLILAFVSAVILWIFIAFSTNPTINVTTKVPVVFTGTEGLRSKELTIVSKENPSYLSVELTGTRGALAENIGSIYIEASLDSINSEGTVTVPTEVIIPSSSVSLVRRKYDSFSVDIESVEEKEIPIVVKQMGSNDQYMVESVPDSDTLLISGAKSEIENIESSVLNVDISEINKDSVNMYTPLLLNGSDIPVTKPISVYMDKTVISVQNNVYVEKTVPLTVKISDSVSSKYFVNIKDISPSEITVGVKEEYNAAVSALELVFSESEYEDGENEYTMTPNRTDGVFIPDDTEEITVTAEIYERVSDVLTLTVEARNLTSGLNAEHVSLMVSVYGPDNLLNSDNIAAYVDASGLTQGSYTLPVYFEKNENVIISGEYTCKINIQ